MKTKNNLYNNYKLNVFNSPCSNRLRHTFLFISQFDNEKFDIKKLINYYSFKYKRTSLVKF